MPAGDLRRRPSRALSRILRPRLRGAAAVLAAASRWRRSTKPISISPAPSACTGLRSPPRTSCTTRSSEPPNLNCSIGIAASRMVAKVASDQAKPNGILWIVPGQEARFLAPLDVRKIPGVGKVTERNLHACGIRKVGDLAALDRCIPRSTLRQMGSGAGGQVARRRRRRLVRRRDRRRRRSEIDQP